MMMRKRTNRILWLAVILSSAGCNKSEDKPLRATPDAQAVAAEPKRSVIDASAATSSKALPDASVTNAPVKTWADQPPLAPTPKPRCKDATLTASMIQFVQALRAEDVEGMIALFPKKRPLKVVSAIAGSATFPFAQAAEEMRSRNRYDGLYSILVDAPDPTFAQYVMDGVEWTWVGGTRFVQDGGERDDHVYVTWRKEDGRWVIDTIGFPMA